MLTTNVKHIKMEASKRRRERMLHRPALTSSWPARARSATPAWRPLAGRTPCSPALLATTHCKSPKPSGEGMRIWNLPPARKRLANQILAEPSHKSEGCGVRKRNLPGGQVYWGG